MRDDLYLHVKLTCKSKSLITDFAHSMHPCAKEEDARCEAGF